MSAFSVIPRGEGRFLAVRSWPGNEEDIENIFGDRVRKVDSTFYDWELVTAAGYEVDPVCRGDWLVLSPSNSIKKYSHKEFEAKYLVMESIFDLPNPTGKQEQA